MIGRKPLLIAVTILVTAIALSLRLPNLSNRPFHGDEAVHAFKFRELREHHVYHYDPNEFHGPSIYYAALPTVALSGHSHFADTTETDYRLAVALIGAAMIPLLLLLRGAMSTKSLLAAGILLAISPAFIFYSRYYIQEVPLVFFTVGLIAFIWRYRVSPSTANACWSGAFAGLMLASKETAPITFVAIGLGLIFSSLPKQPSADNVNRNRWVRPAAIGVIVAIVVAYTLLSGFLSDLTGPFGYFQSYLPWLKRAGGTDLHKHGLLYYFQTIGWSRGINGTIWSEGFILGLGFVGIASSIRSKAEPFHRFLSVFTVTLALIYSIIPYKTPWCALNFHIGFILLGGIVIDNLILKPKSAALKFVSVLVVLAFSGQLTWQAYRSSFLLPADTSNPYVYAQPVNDVTKIKERVDALAGIHPLHDKMVIKIIWPDNYYWPLPWYLRRFDNIGYYNSVPADPNADVVLTTQDFDEVLTKKLDPTHIMTGFTAMRPGVFVESFVRMDLWEPYIKWKKSHEKASE